MTNLFYCCVTINRLPPQKKYQVQKFRLDKNLKRNYNPANLLYKWSLGVIDSFTPEPHTVTPKQVIVSVVSHEKISTYLILPPVIFMSREWLD